MCLCLPGSMGGSICWLKFYKSCVGMLGKDKEGSEQCGECVERLGKAGIPRGNMERPGEGIRTE